MPVILSGFEPSITFFDPTPEMLENPEFKAIWECIKTWDINIPGAYEGHMAATGDHVAAILNALSRSGDREEPTTARLTPAESKVLTVLLDGKTNSEIAQALNIGIGTVRSHVINILGSCNCKNRSEVIAKILTGRIEISTQDFRGRIPTAPPRKNRSHKNRQP